MKKLCRFVLLACTATCCYGAVAGGSEEDERIAWQTEAMAESIINTPYSARIKITSVDALNLPEGDPEYDADTQILVYHADVLQTYRGKAGDRITYRVYAEAGESGDIPEEPVIITLCQAEDGFYSPGVGSAFGGDSPLQELAQSTAERADKLQTTFSDCE